MLQPVSALLLRAKVVWYTAQDNLTTTAHCITAVYNNTYCSMSEMLKV